MTTTKYADIAVQQDALLRKALTGGIHVADVGATAPTLATTFNSVTGALCGIPAGFADIGYLDATGAKFARTVKTSEITSWQSTNPTRVDVTSDEVTCVFVPQETNLQTIAMFYGVEASTILTTPTANGAMVIEKPLIPDEIYRRVMVFGVDEDNSGETIIVRFLPNAKITAYADQSFANGADPIEYGVTVTAFVDDALGYSEAVFFGGAGWLAKLTAMGFTAG